MPVFSGDTERHPIARVLLKAAAATERRSLALDEVHRIGDWQALFDAAEFHGLTPLLHFLLHFRLQSKADAEVERVPPEFADRLSRAYLDSAKRGLVLAASMSDTVSSLAGGGVPVIVLKGPPLARSLYADPALRPSFDLDLLIRPADLAAALDVLRRDGYAPARHMARFAPGTLLQLDCEIVLHHPRRIAIDLHWALSPADYPFRIDPELMWRSKTVIEEMGEMGGASVPVLGREWLLVYLAIHGAKHAWARLLWLADVARAIDRGIDSREALRLAAETGCTRPLLLALLLSHDLLEAAVPDAILQQARADAVVVAAAVEAGARLQRIPPAEPSNFERAAFRARLAHGAWAKARHWSATLVTPTDADFSRWQLPPRLLWLYRPLRLQRVLVKHGRKILHLTA